MSSCYSLSLSLSSPAEKAYEVAAGGADDVEGQQDRLGLVGKHNSIFVAALKDHLQAERGSLKDTVQTLFNATAKSKLTTQMYYIILYS